MAHDRDIGGIRCLEVLAALPDYLDGDLDPDLKARIDDHLAGCDWCERFGGEYAGTVKALRALARPEPSLDAIERRLLERLNHERDRE